MRGLVIAGTHSGVGKTTVATGIMAALRRRGYLVQPFKAGPDYIDPSYHGAACGMPSRNLDTWLLTEQTVVELFARAVQGKDVAVVEGVMGLFDGFQGDTEEGSTAHLAKLLQLPVVLVVDASAAARSVGAMVLGFQAFDPNIKLAGVVLNGVAGPNHLEFIKPSLAQIGVPLLGYLPKSPGLQIPERYLGLVPVAEGTVAQQWYLRLAKQVEATVDLDLLMDLAAPVHATGEFTELFPREPQPKRTAIAVAMDKAFSFYYADSLDLLRAWGATLVPFSPLEDQELPQEAGGVFLGGGFPELYAKELSENTAMLQQLRDAAHRGMPIYAECGGLMYLGQSLEDQEGKTYGMAGVLPARSSLRGSRLTLGYRTVRALHDTSFLRAGDNVRGHEFHLSSLGEPPSPEAAVYQLAGSPGQAEGFRMNSVTASYVHLHLGSKAGMAQRYVDLCAQWKALTSLGSNGDSA